MRARVQWKREAKRKLIVDEALGLLKRVGMRFGVCQTLDALAEAGAAVEARRLA